MKLEYGCYVGLLHTLHHDELLQKGFNSARWANEWVREWASEWWVSGWARVVSEWVSEWASEWWVSGWVTEFRKITKQKLTPQSASKSSKSSAKTARSPQSSSDNSTTHVPLKSTETANSRRHKSVPLPLIEQRLSESVPQVEQLMWQPIYPILTTAVIFRSSQLTARTSPT